MEYRIKLGTTPVSEVSRTFLQGMADRMGVSWRKYGLVEDAYPKAVDAVLSLKQRLALYESTGNAEWLMDVANFAMIEFMRPRHELAHYDPDVKSPGRIGVTGHSVYEKENLDIKDEED